MGQILLLAGQFCSNYFICCSIAVPFLGIGKLGCCLGRHQLEGAPMSARTGLHLSRVVIKSGTVTLKYCCPHWIPQRHWVWVQSFWRCLYITGSKRCQLLPLIVACKVCIWSAQQCVRFVFVLFHVIVFMSFILKFSYGFWLVHASLALMSLCHWFPCSLCHVFIGFCLVMCPVVFVISSHVLAFSSCRVLML